MKILVIEDGYEYFELLQRFLGVGEQFTFHRVQNGKDALEVLARGDWHGVLLDLCFDRIPVDELYGDIAEIAEQFNGRVEESRQYVIRNQGIFILAAIREADFDVPVLLSHDYSREMTRWERLVKRYGPLQFVSDNAGPEQIKTLLMQMGR